MLKFVNLVSLISIYQFLSENLKTLQSIHSSNFQFESSQRKVFKELNVKNEKEENLRVENAFIPLPSAHQPSATSHQPISHQPISHQPISPSAISPSDCSYFNNCVKTATLQFSAEYKRVSHTHISELDEHNIFLTYCCKSGIALFCLEGHLKSRFSPFKPFLVLTWPGFQMNSSWRRFLRFFRINDQIFVKEAP